VEPELLIAVENILVSPEFRKKEIYNFIYILLTLSLPLTDSYIFLFVAVNKSKTYV